MNFDVRILQPADVAVLREVLGVFAAAFEDPNTYSANQPSDQYLRGLLSEKTVIAIAAVSGSQVVGGLAAYLLPKFEQARSEIYIYDLAVAEECRRAGTATAMIRTLQVLATRLNAWVVSVQADHGDEPATRLYSKLGVREEVLHFDIRPINGDG